MIIVGVDAGGTLTKAIAYDENGNYIGESLAGVGNFHNVGLDVAKRNIYEAIYKSTKGKFPSIVVIGAAGLDSKYDEEILNSALSDLGDKVIVVHDSFIVLYSQKEDTKGVVVISGTGSVVVGYADKKRIRAGGYGWLLSDQGSAYWIGRKALRIIVKMLDGRIAKSSLAHSILNELKLTDLDDLVKWAYYEGHKIEKVASLAKVVCDEAEKGDIIALNIVDTAAKLLAEDARYVAYKLGEEEIYISGGMFNSKVYLERFKFHLNDIRAIKVTRPPVYGALLYGFKIAGLKRPKIDYSNF
jgi:N-acetylglucosamine kinase-like BadF-type ATPase